MTRNHHVLAGRLKVRVVDRRGHTHTCTVRENTIVDTGRNLVGQLLLGKSAAPVTHLAVGTNKNPSTPDDKKIEEIDGIARVEIEAEALSQEIGFRIRGQVKSTVEQAVSEAGLFNTDGVLYNRVVFPSPLPVGPNLDLIFEWDITF